MNKETLGYDPMSVHADVDALYSGDEVIARIRAQRAIAQESTVRRFGRVTQVRTVMNERIAELFGERTKFDGMVSAIERASLNHNSAAQDEITVVQDR